MVSVVGVVGDAGCRATNNNYNRCYGCCCFTFLALLMQQEIKSDCKMVDNLKEELKYSQSYKHALFGKLLSLAAKMI